jgi:putative salt-induced outer membrane protein YdiY
MNLRHVFGAAIALCTFATAAVAAQQADTTKKSLKFTGDVGLVNASGNSSVTTFNTDERVDWTAGAWGITQSFSVIYGKNDSATTASTWHGLLRGDRSIGSRLSLYALVNYDRNTFAGFDRRFEEGLGLGIQALRAPRDTINAEAGLSYQQQHSIAGPEDDFPSARVAGTYTHTFSKTAFFRQGVEVLPDLKVGRNVRFNTETALVASLSANIALKFSYVVHFDNEPEPGFKKSDRLLTSGVQVTF